MFNNNFTNEEAKIRIEERVKEAETYSLHKRLGFGDSGVTRLIFVLVILIAVGVVGLLL